jgi:hypothetical protein
MAGLLPGALAPAELLRERDRGRWARVALCVKGPLLRAQAPQRARGWAAGGGIAAREAARHELREAIAHAAQSGSGALRVHESAH